MITGQFVVTVVYYDGRRIVKRTVVPARASNFFYEGQKAGVKYAELAIHSPRSGRTVLSTRSNPRHPEIARRLMGPDWRGFECGSITTDSDVLRPHIPTARLTAAIESAGWSESDFLAQIDALTLEYPPAKPHA